MIHVMTKVKTFELIHWLQIGVLAWGETYNDLANNLAQYWLGVGKAENPTPLSDIRILKSPDGWFAILDQRTNGSPLAEGEMEKIVNLFYHLNNGGRVILNSCYDELTSGSPLKWEEIELTQPTQGFYPKEEKIVEAKPSNFISSKSRYDNVPIWHDINMTDERRAIGYMNANESCIILEPFATEDLAKVLFNGKIGFVHSDNLEKFSLYKCVYDNIIVWPNPSLDELLGTLNKWESYMCIEASDADGSFAAILFNGKVGYVSFRYLEKVPQ